MSTAIVVIEWIAAYFLAIEAIKLENLSSLRLKLIDIVMRIYSGPAPLSWEVHMRLVPAVAIGLSIIYGLAIVVGISASSLGEQYLKSGGLNYRGREPKRPRFLEERRQ